jgi:osmoprotectant transport system permease protein
MSGLLLAADKPVIPDFGQSSDCVRENRLFCPDWVHDNWGAVIQPALVQHIVLTLIAVMIGFTIAFAAALIAHRFRKVEAPVVLLSAFLYTVPSLALFQLLVPITGLTRATVEVALVGYTLLILFRNILAGLRATPPDVLEAAIGMGLTRFQVLKEIELPLALPAIMAGLRITTVSTIALLTVGGVIEKGGLGQLMFDAFQNERNAMLLVAVVLIVLLALVADLLLLLLQRIVTPWERVRS